eukprot:COSAG06_NODE_7127_length_2621_cov_1.434576_2_plen_179_part_00
MAAGIGDAAAVVPFMTQQYQSSVNCKLELKFAQQTGVPIVPVMAQQNWTPRGWLGLLTAGLLWTPVLDDSSIPQAMDSLNHQIQVALSDNSDCIEMDEELDDTSFSVDELRQELGRLKKDQDNTGGAPPATELGRSSRAWVPAAVPEVPSGVLVTQSMEQLLSHLVAGTDTRVGFLVN